MKRDETLDALKGLAILFVVMGHVMAGCFSRGGADSSFLFKLIYSFHMPLFLFVSGVLCGGGRKRSVKDLVGSKLRTLLVPWLVANVMIRFFYAGSSWMHWPNPFANGPTGYWYLQVLFIFAVLFGVMTVLTDRIKCLRWRAAVEVVMVLACLLLIVRYERWYYRVQYVFSPIFANFEYWQVRRRMLWFALGFFVARYDLWRYIVNRWVSAFSILAFVPVVCLGAGFLLEACGSLAGIMASLNVFRDETFRKCKLFSVLKFFGLYTMQIYILHYLFLPSFNGFGDWITVMNGLNGRVSTLVFQIAYSGIVSAVIVVCCLALAKMIATSSIANRVLFGGR